MPAGQEQTTATGNTQKKYGEDRTCSSEDMIVDRQTHIHTDTLITILCSLIGGGVKRHGSQDTDWVRCFCSLQ